MQKSSKKNIVIIGAGPAGLTAAHELSNKNEKYKVTILEKDQVVGGLSKTVNFKGCKFDIGPHHFITGEPEIEKWWKNIMGQDKFFHLKRFTRIYYKKHFFMYPLQVWNVLGGLNIFECIGSVASYFWVRLFPIKKVKSLQDWVTNQFGRRLFSIFFKSYSEKLWGISCAQISSDWAAQRIKSFSLGKAVFYAFFGRWFKKNIPRTIQDDFYYPELGAGFLWEKVAKNVKEKGAQIYFDSQVVVIEHRNKKIEAVYTKKTELKNCGGQKLKVHRADNFISSMPLSDLIFAMVPIVPAKVLQATKELRYRALATVNLIVDKKDVCQDHWLYIHEPKVEMLRIGNMKNFSVKMTDDPNHTILSLEYFTFLDSPFWAKTDEELLKIGIDELEKMDLVKSDQIIDGMVLRCNKAYPVYDQDYKKHLNVVLNFLKQFSNLYLVGRNGLHRYNNMDHAMLTAMEVVQEIKKQNMPEVKISSISNL